MVRKSSQNGSGHLPLTSHERKTYSKAGDYGTTSQRLSGISQRTFGHCCLGLAPAKEDPVATPSGHIYERSAILEYLLTKTQELKQQQDAYDRQVAAQEAKQQEELNTAKRKEVESFEATQKVVSSKKQKVDDSVNPLAKTSYWLSEFGPEGAKASDLKEPPKRSPSPNSQRPLRRKDLIPLALRFNESDQAICGVSEKTIIGATSFSVDPKKVGQASAGRAGISVPRFRKRQSLPCFRSEAAEDIEITDRRKQLCVQWKCHGQQVQSHHDLIVGQCKG